MMLELESVQKSYRGFSLNCSLAVQEGCITGLIGANGAGKSTTFKSILGLVHIEGGSIRIFGKDLKKIGANARKEIGVVLSESTLPDCLTVKQMAGIMAREYQGFQMEYFVKQCRRFSVPLDKKLKEFSTGMKAKAKILFAVSHQARLLILDEPTAGLDVVARDSILEILREYMETEGRAILISSHISADLEGFCDDLYMIDAGRVVLHEETDNLLDHYAILKVEEKDYQTFDRSYVLRKKKEPFGYSCLTNQKNYYAENYPSLVIEKGSIDEVILMMTKGEEA
jgi:ABC-2 type transport system ATP-binding protein